MSTETKEKLTNEIGTTNGNERTNNSGGISGDVQSLNVEENQNGSKKNENKSKLYLIIGIVIVLLIITLIIVLSIVLTSQDNNKTNGGAKEQSTPTPTFYDIQSVFNYSYDQPVPGEAYTYEGGNFTLNINTSMVNASLAGECFLYYDIDGETLLNTSYVIMYKDLNNDANNNYIIGGFLLIDIYTLLLIPESCVEPSLKIINIIYNNNLKLYEIYVSVPSFDEVFDDLDVSLDVNNTFFYQTVTNVTVEDTDTAPETTQDPQFTTTLSPSFNPTNKPSASPTLSPSPSPTLSPSYAPSNTPVQSPSNSPSTSPTHFPSPSPSYSPSDTPSNSPTHFPSPSPSYSPSDAPSNSPTLLPTPVPTVTFNARRRLFKCDFKSTAFRRFFGWDCQGKEKTFALQLPLSYNGVVATTTKNNIITYIEAKVQGDVEMEGDSIYLKVQKRAGNIDKLEFGVNGDINFDITSSLYGYKDKSQKDDEVSQIFSLSDFESIDYESTSIGFTVAGLTFNIKAYLEVKIKGSNTDAIRLNHRWQSTNDLTYDWDTYYNSGSWSIEKSTLTNVNKVNSSIPGQTNSNEINPLLSSDNRCFDGSSSHEIQIYISMKVPKKTSYISKLTFSSEQELQWPSTCDSTLGCTYYDSGIPKTKSTYSDIYYTQIFTTQTTNSITNNYYMNTDKETCYNDLSSSSDYTTFVYQCCTPTDVPTRNPTRSPSIFPTKVPTNNPTRYPTRVPSIYPTKTPSIYPTRIPTKVPSVIPTKIPSTNPTKIPTKSPSVYPTKIPSTNPTRVPTKSPSVYPTRIPTNNPTRFPTRTPTRFPTIIPTNAPSIHPTISGLLVNVLTDVKYIDRNNNALDDLYTDLKNLGILTLKNVSSISSFFYNNKYGYFGTHALIIPKLNGTFYSSLNTSQKQGLKDYVNEYSGILIMYGDSNGYSDSFLQNIFGLSWSFDNIQSNTDNDVYNKSNLISNSVINSLYSTVPSLLTGFAYSLQSSSVNSINAIYQRSSDNNTGVATSVYGNYSGLITYIGYSYARTGASSGTSWMNIVYANVLGNIITSLPTFNPTIIPSLLPSHVPSVIPTQYPSSNPTIIPTNNPTVIPTQSPSSNPTIIPTNNPTVVPTQSPKHLWILTDNIYVDTTYYNNIYSDLLQISPALIIINQSLISDFFVNSSSLYSNVDCLLVLSLKSSISLDSNQLIVLKDFVFTNGNNIIFIGDGNNYANNLIQTFTLNNLTWLSDGTISGGSNIFALKQNTSSIALSLFANAASSIALGSLAAHTIGSATTVEYIYQSYTYNSFLQVYSANFYYPVVADYYGNGFVLWVGYYWLNGVSSNWRQIISLAISA